MKITKENLEGVSLTRNGNFQKGTCVYHYAGECAHCGDTFLSLKRNGSLSDYCCRRCAGHYKEFSQEHRRKISIANTGKRHSEEAKQKQRIAKLGEKNPNFGKPLSIEARQVISDAHRGKIISIETRQKMSDARKGMVVSTKTKLKISKTKIENSKNRPNFGKKPGKGKSNLMVLNNDIPLYDTYARQLEEVFEEVRIYMLRIGCVVYKTLQVRCHNSSCRKWFRPSLIKVKCKIQAFRGNLSGEQNFYCSGGCKASCSTYRRQLWPAGQNPNQKEKPYTKEEYDLYRQTVLERENYICEYCGAPATEVHHEQTQKEQPMLALDPDYGHATCKPCHYEYGHKTGTECSTGNLAKKIC